VVGMGFCVSDGRFVGPEVLNVGMVLGASLSADIGCGLIGVPEPVIEGFRVCCNVIKVGVEVTDNVGFGTDAAERDGAGAAVEPGPGGLGSASDVELGATSMDMAVSSGCRNLSKESSCSWFSSYHEKPWRSLSRSTSLPTATVFQRKLRRIILVSASAEATMIGTMKSIFMLMSNYSQNEKNP